MPQVDLDSLFHEVEIKYQLKYQSCFYNSLWDLSIRITYLDFVYPCLNYLEGYEILLSYAL